MPVTIMGVLPYTYLPPPGRWHLRDCFWHSGPTACEGLGQLHAAARAVIRSDQAMVELLLNGEWGQRQNSNQHRVNFSSVKWTSLELAALINSDTMQITYLAKHTHHGYPLHECVAQRSPSRVITRLMQYCLPVRSTREIKMD